MVTSNITYGQYSSFFRHYYSKCRHHQTTIHKKSFLVSGLLSSPYISEILLANNCVTVPKTLMLFSLGTKVSIYDTYL